MLDLVIAGVPAAWVVLGVRDLARKRTPGRRSRGLVRTLGQIALRTALWAAALYVIFVVVWGLNYRRVSLADKLPFDQETVTPGRALELARTAVSEVNRLYAAAHATDWPDGDAIDPALASALAEADRAVGGAGVVRPGRPKATLLDWYFRKTATDGMTDPYFLETLVSTTLLPFERPFVFAHEWSHLAGVADEGDANFVAWLACVHASPSSQYSGWLFLYEEVARVLSPDDRADVARRLDSGPRADLNAIRARVLRDISPAIAEAGRRAYDSYLKANRVEAGVNSYGRVVRLVLGVRFGPDWTIATR
jgi:hypothetical protein